MIAFSGGNHRKLRSRTGIISIEEHEERNGHIEPCANAESHLDSRS
jgi:hypothetical protein